MSALMSALTSVSRYPPQVPGARSQGSQSVAVNFYCSIPTSLQKTYGNAFFKMQYCNDNAMTMTINVTVFV